MPPDDQDRNLSSDASSPRETNAPLSEILAAVRGRVDQAAVTSGRAPADVSVLLAIKTVHVTRIREAIEAGGTVLGQNRAQELLATEPDLADLPHATHFIGHLQSNKVNAVTRWVTCVQTVDTATLAQRLARASEQRESPLEVLIQVNTSGEESKSGVSPDEAADFAAQVADLPTLRLQGFMTIGANSPDLGLVRASYDALAQVREAVANSAIPGTEGARTLSMGMSGDLEIAIAAGATMVRVGSAVFGSRLRP